LDSKCIGAARENLNIYDITINTMAEFNYSMAETWNSFQYTSLIVLRLMTFSIDFDLSEASNDRFKNTNEPFGPISTHMYDRTAVASIL
jgi:hypothetical protein